MPRWEPRILPVEQTCSRCKTLKPIAAFPMQHDRAVPLKQCRACADALEAQRVEDAKNHAEGTRVCSVCRVKKPLTDFALRGRANERHFKCAVCVAAYSARHYLASREREEGRAQQGMEQLVASGAVTRPCGDCKRDLPLLQFVRDRRSPDGFKRTCRACDLAAARKRLSTIDAEGERRRAWGANLKRYGITPDIFDAISKSQGHRCRICGVSRDTVKDKYGFHVDHSHTTEHVRGLLCRNCNIALGTAQENPNILMAMVRYLELPVGPPPHATLATWRAFLTEKEKAPLAEGFPKVMPAGLEPKDPSP